jgi:DMSO/TMAO reductase YedYZ molybdopterin-dependent catalytic subunit
MGAAVKKISRRLFLFLFLSGSASLYVATRPGATKSQTNFVLHVTSTDQPGLIPTLSPTSQPGLMPSSTPTDDPVPQAATAVPINVVISNENTNCITPVIAPTEPAVIPNEAGVDENTGRHMMGDVQVLDLQSYRLTVTGLVDHPLSLTYDDLRCMPKMTETVTTTCYSFADSATWSGVLISDVLKKAGMQPTAKKVTLKAPDGAVRTVSLEMALDQHNFLAYEMDGKPLPVLFGFPVRSIFINVAGQYSVKWLTSLEVI